MRKADPEEGWKNVGIISQYPTEPWFPEHTVAEFFQSVYRSEVEDADYTGEVASCLACNLELVDKLLDTLDY